MNLKYYLRGLGIGIAMTVIILGLGREKETLSDAEIKQRAAELGMIESSGLLSEREEIVEESDEMKSAVPTQTPEDTEEIKETETSKPTEEPKATEEPEATEAPKPTEEPEATEAPEVTETPKPTEEPKATEEPEVTQEPKETEEPEATEAPEATEKPDTETKAESITIVVNPGDGSYTVCKRMEEAGLIASATAFDEYMNQNGYDKKLQVGTFEIPADAEPEEMVMILMKRK